MANRRYSSQFRFSFHHFPVSLDCNFVVDKANGNGLGLRSLKTEGISAVYMNSTASFTGTTHTGTNVVDSISGGTSSLLVGMQVQTTDLPAGTTIAGITSSSAITLNQPATTGHAGATITYQAAGNPNPAPGYIVVQFSDSYNSYIDGYSGQVSPYTGSPISSGLTVGDAYIIASPGASTAAQWQTAGLPSNVTPTAGQAFIAEQTSVAGGGTVLAVGVSGIDHIEVVGDPRTTLTSNKPGQGGYMVLQCLSAGSVTAPNDNSVVGLDFQLSNSNLY